MSIHFLFYKSDFSYKPQWLCFILMCDALCVVEILKYIAIEKNNLFYDGERNNVVKV